MLIGTLALVALGSFEMHAVLAVGGLSTLEYAVLTLFVVNFAWIALSFVSASLGAISLWRSHGRQAVAQEPEAPPPKTALLLPVYNEDPSHVSARAEAILASLRDRGALASFELFVLSDSTDPETWLAEEDEFDDLRGRQPDAGIHYRHRSQNRARKSGNIEDFVTRWGRAFRYMVVLDADSLMTGATLVELVRRMEREPSLGLLQTVPRLVNAVTLFARMQQFATRVYGPVIGAGIATWHGDASNFWGHNAIIRTAAFARCCGLPELAGRAPFGGHVLSHDFVEAALLRRAGWNVRLAADLDGSYEEAPPTVIDTAVRDRRWAQGNLQHARVLGARGLHWLSRFHLLSGIMSYLASPLWLLLLLSGLALALQAHFIRPQYFPDGFALFPTWPVIDPERAARLFGFTMLVLLLPKAMGVVLYLREPGARRFVRAVGGTLGMLVELVLSALLAPIFMLCQTRAVVEILLRRDSGWSAQRRDGDKVPFSALWRFHRNHVVAGVALAGAAYAVSPPLLAWLSPAVIGLVLSPWLSSLTSSRRLGRHSRSLGLLRVPEETNPPEVAVMARRILARRRAVVPIENAVRHLLERPGLLEMHRALLLRERGRAAGTIDVDLAVARLKLDEAPDLTTAFDSLTRGERLAILKDISTLDRLRREFYAPAKLSLAETSRIA